MKVRAIAFLAVFGLTIVAAVVGNVLESKGILTREKLGPRGIAAVMMAFFALFCLICFTLVPLALRFFLDGQTRIGNGEVGIIRWLHAHENGVVVAFWVFIVAGFGIAYVLAKDEILKNLP